MTVNTPPKVQSNYVSKPTAEDYAWLIRTSRAAAA